MDEQFMYEEFHTALTVDALESTHPLVAEVDKPSTIGAMFDNISYNKGKFKFRGNIHNYRISTQILQIFHRIKFIFLMQKLH
jgi:hypothetical protein